MMVGIIAKLRRGFEYVGGKGVYNPITLQGERAMCAFGFASITNLNGAKHIAASSNITTLFMMAWFSIVPGINPLKDLCSLNTLVFIRREQVFSGVLSDWAFTITVSHAWHGS